MSKEDLEKLIKIGLMQKNKETIINLYLQMKFERDIVEEQLSKLKAESERLLNETGYLIFADGYDENDKPIYKQIYKTYKESNKELEEENLKLQQQLKEKDEEIEKISKSFDEFEKNSWETAKNLANEVNKFRDEAKELKTKLKSNTKQVCEKIREKLKPHYGEEVCGVTVEEVLKQIERNECNE